MSQLRWIFPLLVAASSVLVSPRGIRAADDPELMVWKIDGDEREALVYIPKSAKKSESPLVFVFHGHGGG